MEFARCYPQCNSHRTTFVKRFRPEHHSKDEVYKVMKSEGLARSGAQRRFFELPADTCHRQQRRFVSRRFYDYASKHFNHVHIQYQTLCQACWNGFIEPWKAKKCTGIYMTVRKMRIACWPHTESATSVCARIVPFDRPVAVALWCRPMST